MWWPSPSYNSTALFLKHFLRLASALPPLFVGLAATTTAATSVCGRLVNLHWLDLGVAQLGKRWSFNHGHQSSFCIHSSEEAREHYRGPTISRGVLLHVYVPRHRHPLGGRIRSRSRPACNTVRAANCLCSRWGNGKGWRYSGERDRHR